MKDTTPHTDPRVTDHQQIFSGKLLRLVVDRLCLPDGSQITREVIHHPAAAAILPVLSNGRILLVKQYRHPVHAQLWEIPAGLIDPGETPLITAKRELREETGYEAEKWERRVSFFTSPGFTDEAITLFIAQDLARITDPDPQEIDKCRAFTASELIDLIDNGTIRDGKTILAIISFDHTST